MYMAWIVDFRKRAKQDIIINPITGKYTIEKLLCLGRRRSNWSDMPENLAAGSSDEVVALTLKCVR